MSRQKLQLGLLSSFWLKNNGITIVCGDFEIDGREVKLRDFSIINGGQTTYRDFPGGPVVKTLSFHRLGHEFDPCLGN